MIQELLGQTNFVGRDGFYWWIGQIETQKGSQPKKSDDRYKVRIIGQHLKDCNAVPYDDLPWAIVMMPPTAPRREGNTDFKSVKYKAGDWVIGFFLDGHNGQKPVIMGSIGQQYNSTVNINKDKPEGECLAFTTFADKTINTSLGVSAATMEQQKAGQTPDLKEPPNTSNESGSTILLGTKCCNSEANPGGEYFCVEVSDAKCQKGDNDRFLFQNILADLFYNIQMSGGQFGNKIVSKYTGELYNYVNIAKGYINKATRLGSSLVGRIKGEVFALIKQGAKQVIEFLLTEEVVDEKFVGPYADPEKAVEKTKKRVGRLRGITAWLNEQLKNVNCTLADLDKRLSDFIEQLIYGALDKVFNAARCYVDKIVNDIFGKIASFLNDALTLILGPLQQLLDIIASPLNILGAALAKIFDLLGISCGGYVDKCAGQDQLNDCSGSCGNKESEDDFLDNLIKAIESGNYDGTSGSCSDFQNIPSIASTRVFLIGGVPNPESFSGSEPTILPADYTDPTLAPETFDDQVTTNPTFTDQEIQDSITTPSNATPVTTRTEAPSTVSDVLNNINFVNVDFVSTPIIRIPANSNAADTFTRRSIVNGNGDTVTVQTFTRNSSSSLTLSGSAVTSAEYVDTTPENITYNLSLDKTLLFKGDSITFTFIANGGVVPDGTVFNYTMFGNIVPEMFADNTITGTMVMYGNVATRSITLVSDTYITKSELVTFSINETGSSVPFNVVPQTISQGTSSTTTPVFVPPTLGNPEVCGDGRIVDIPIASRGDRYLVPPIVVIEGAGFGASAYAELDNQGYVKKIVVRTPGIGYAPSRTRKNCVITDFILLNPGSGYFNTPTVYVNGKSNIAKAVINSSGYVVGLDVIDKTQTFECTPKIDIFGGNGLGAKAVPIMECRDQEAYSRFVQSIAPSGTDNVIDCP